MHKITLFRSIPRIVMGPGAIGRLSAEISELQAKKVLFVTDKGLVATGMIDAARQALEPEGIQSAVYDKVEADPRYEIVADCVAAIKEAECDLVVGFGGGSPIDIAKMAAVMATNPDAITAYFGIDLIPRPGLPTIMVPTTAGTGSEVTPIAILSDHSEKLKRGIVSKYLFPAAAILDPELTVGLPPAITASTGMDALVHAIEAYTSKNATAMTDMLAVEAMQRIAENLRTAWADGVNLPARAGMLEGSLLAGMAFANAGVTAVHAFAYPIGAEFHIPHGVANSIMLVPVMAFNKIGNLEKFADIAALLGEETEGLSAREAADVAVEAMRTLRDDLGITQGLGAYGIEERHIPALAQGVMKVTRLLANNPRTLTLADAEMIYREVL